MRLRSIVVVVRAAGKLARAPSSVAMDRLTGRHSLRLFGARIAEAKRKTPRRAVARRGVSRRLSGVTSLVVVAVFELRQRLELIFGSIHHGMVRVPFVVAVGLPIGRCGSGSSPRASCRGCRGR